MNRKHEMVQKIWDSIASTEGTEQAQGMEHDVVVLREILHDDVALFDIDGITDDMTNDEAWAWFVEQMYLIWDVRGGSLDEWLTEDMWEA